MSSTALKSFTDASELCFVLLVQAIQPGKQNMLSRQPKLKTFCMFGYGILEVMLDGLFCFPAVLARRD